MNKELCGIQERKLRAIKEMLKEIIKYINEDSQSNENTRKKE